jgi:hypothetical protein
VFDDDSIHVRMTNVEMLKRSNSCATILPLSPMVFEVDDSAEFGITPLTSEICSSTFNLSLTVDRIGNVIKTCQLDKGDHVCVNVSDTETETKAVLYLYDEQVYLSEKSTGHRNRAIAYLELNNKMIQEPIEDHLDTYFRQCSVLINARDLAIMGATLANQGVNPLTAEQAEKLAKSFDRQHKGFRKAHKTGILSGGAVFKPTTIANDQAQMLDSRRLAVEDVARAYRVPTDMIGLNNGGQSYNSIEQKQIAFLTHTLRPWLAKLEDAFSTLLPDTAYLAFSTDDLLRGDYATRIEGYAKLLQNGVLSTNEVRRKENMRPIDGGDVVRVPLTNVNIAAASLTEDETKVDMAQKLIALGFVPEDVLKSLGLNPIAHTGLPTVQLQNPTTVPDGSYETGA